MKKDHIKIFLFLVFLIAVVIATGFISVSVIEYKFKGAICHNIDEEECTHRYNVYKHCVETIKLHKDIDLGLGKNLCFRTAFFDTNPRQ